jgi:pyruvate/2-oxoacid:ferredoxin oxidoreductase alpha subunit
MARGAVGALRAAGIPVGLFRPQTVWPFPVRHLLPLLGKARSVVVVEASDGQLEDELRLALSHAGAGGHLAYGHVRRHGGVLPSQGEIEDAARAMYAGKAVAA